MYHSFQPHVCNNDGVRSNFSVTNFTVPTEAEAQFNQTVGLDIKAVEEKMPDQYVTSNFNTNGLVIAERSQSNADEPVVDQSYYMDSNHLISETVDPPSRKFAVQSIPDGEEPSMLPNPNIYDAIVADVNERINKQANAKPEFVTRKMSNWITRLLDQRGEDYISSGKLSTDEVGRNADRIIDDMIAGRIDYTKQGQYIIEPVIIETLINYCANKLAINKAIQYSLGYVYNDYTNRYNINPEDENRIQSLACITDNISRNITQAISIVNQDIMVYEIIYARLQYVLVTKNASSLFNLSTELNQARKQIKKRY